jgi:hypothetical protein
MASKSGKFLTSAALVIIDIGFHFSEFQAETRTVGHAAGDERLQENRGRVANNGLI